MKCAFSIGRFLFEFTFRINSAHKNENRLDRNTNPPTLDADQRKTLHEIIEEQSNKLWQRTTYFITLSFGGAIYLITSKIDLLTTVIAFIVVWLLYWVGMVQYRRQERVLDIMKDILVAGSPDSYWYNILKQRYRTEKGNHRFWPSFNIEKVFLGLWILMAILFVILISHKMGSL